MATKKVKVSNSSAQVIGGDVELDEENDLTSEERDALAALIDIEGGSEARWQVFRIAQVGSDKPSGFLGEMSSNELRMAEVQRRFGSGKYRIKGLRPNGTYIKSTTIDIAQDAPLRGGNVQIDTASDDPMTVLRLMQERDEKRADRNREMMLALLPAALTTFGGVLTALVSRPAQQNNVLSDLATLKTVLGSNDEKPTTLETVFKALELGMKNAGGGGETSWPDVVKQVAMEVLPAVAAMRGAPSQPTAPASLPAPTPPNPRPEDTGMFATLNWARDTFNFLVKKAAVNADVSLYVDYVLDNIPEGVDATKFVGYLSAPDWWSKLLMFCPACEPYQAWFDEFRTVLIETLKGVGAAHTDEST